MKKYWYFIEWEILGVVLLFLIELSCTLPFTITRAFIFGLNCLRHCGVTVSFGVFFHEIECNRMTCFKEFMNAPLTVSKNRTDTVRSTWVLCWQIRSRKVSLLFNGYLIGALILNLQCATGFFFFLPAAIYLQ